MTRVGYNFHFLGNHGTFFDISSKLAVYQTMNTTFSGQTKPRHGKPGIGEPAHSQNHTAVTAGSLRDHCLDPEKMESHLLCLHAELSILGARDVGGGQTFQEDAGEYWQGGVVGQGTLQIADGQHHLGHGHSQGGGRHQTPGSSVSSASMICSARSASLP